MTAIAESTKRAITPKDWKDIEQKLIGFYSTVKLICDGYELSLVLQRVTQFKNVISFYVNGSMQGKWLLEDCEERRRFFRPRTKKFRSDKELNKIKKIDKEWYKELVERNTFYYHDISWTSFSALKAHLIKNNKVIEVIINDLED